MPVVSVDVRDGDPVIQASGQYRGTVDVVFDDGRQTQRNIRAADQDEWNDKLAAIAAIIEEEQATSDAQAEVAADREVQDSGEATKKHVALAYLRTAYSEPDPYVAYLKFARFNDWRVAEGHSLDDVTAALAIVGLTSEEWVDMKARYQYLSTASRVTAMEAYQGVVAGDIWVS